MDATKKGAGELSQPPTDSAAIGAHSHRSHSLMMILCCLAPLLLIGGMRLAGLSLTGGLAVVAMLACPAAHLLMMRGMHRGRGKGSACHGEPRPLADAAEGKRNG